MDKINHCINHNRFIPIDTEELTALELIGKTVEKTNEVVEKSNNHEDRISENERKKVSFDDMKEKFKFNNETDIDYRGKWFGLDEPTLSDEGMKSQVQKNRDDIIKATEQLDSKVNKGEGGIITNEMLSQEVKESMTGGSVAVVGKNTILTENIVDKQVTTTKTNFMTIGKNLYNKDDVTNGRFYGSDGQTASNEAWCYIDIPVISGVSYSFSGARTMVCFYSSTNVVILGGDDNTNLTLQAPSGASYVRVSTLIAQKMNIQVEQNNTITSFEKYGNIIANSLYYTKAEVDDKVGGGTTIKTTTIEVPKNFANIRLALESIKDSNYYNRYIVKLSEGVYDVKAYYNSTELADTNLKGMLVPKYTKLIGIGSREKIVLKWINPTMSSKLSTINLDLTAEIENLTLYADKIRYAVHDDWTDRKWDNVTPFVDYWSKDCNEKNWYRTIKNCYIEINEGYVGPAWGAGNMSGIKWRFIDCTFKCLLGGTPFSVHNNGGFSQSTYTDFENCRFITTGNSFVRFSTLSNGANGIINYARFKGCKSINGGKVELKEENPTEFGKGCLFKVSGYGNTFSNADVTIKTTDGVDYTYNIDLI